MRAPYYLSGLLIASLAVSACGDDLARVARGDIADIADVAFQPTQIDRSSQQQFRIRNNGDGDLIIANIEIVDASPYIRFSAGFATQRFTEWDWRIDNGTGQSWLETPPAILEPSREIQVDLIFQPETQDPLCPGDNPTESCGRIIIESDDRNDPVIELNITLNQSAGTVNVEPTVIDFPDVVGGPFTEEFTITNIGSGALTGVTVTDPGVEGLTLAETTNRPEPFTLQPSEESTYEVTFEPQSGVDYCPNGEDNCTLGSITVNSNDAQGRVVAITVRVGEGSVPDIETSSNRLEFDNAAVGDPETLTLDVSNTGGANLTWNLRIDPAAIRPVFALEVAGTAIPTSGANISTPIAPDNSQAVLVTLDPANENPIVGNLVITSNDPDESPLRIGLFGGQPAPDLNVEPTQLVFQDVGQGESAELTLVLVNPGRTTLTISAGTISGASANEFSTDPVLTNATVPPSGRLPVTVIYDRPGGDVGGLDTATLQIVSDALEPNNSINVPLFAHHGATALPPTAEIDVTPEQGTYSVGETITLDASASEAPEDGELPGNPFNWVIVDRPSISRAELTSDFEAQTSITPDVAGTYTILLTVTATIDMTTSTQAQRSINLLVE